MSFPMHQGAVAAAGGGTPLDYSNLVAFWESETNVTSSVGEVTQWDDQGSSSISLTVPVGDPGPDLEANTQNGFDGVSFEEFQQSEPIDKKMTSADSALDNLFFGAGTKAIHFAGRWDRAADFEFNLPSVICSKGTTFSLKDGWRLQIKSDGTIEFEQFMTNGSSWKIAASGFYSVDDLVLGSLRYSGGNTSGSGTFRLWNGSSFVETGTVTTASSSTKEDDSAADFVMGNIINPNDSTANSPYEGPLFGLWITKPFQISLDDNYMQRWIP